jgi:thiol-disulfide isomerase/thioredoxin
MRLRLWKLTFTAWLVAPVLFAQSQAPAGGSRAPAGLEGRPAPALDTGTRLGPRVPSIAELEGRVILLFFWAHWCAECKAQSPTLGRVVEKYRTQGLVLIAPTQEYGYVTEGRAAQPGQERRHIVQVRDKYYPFLKSEAVPLAEVNAERYQLAGVPKIVLIDRRGIVRVDRSGRMTEEELEAAIRKWLAIGL